MTRTLITRCEACDVEGDGVFCVVAETKHGERFILGNFDTRDSARAHKMATRVRNKGSIDLDFWVDHYPVYGSEAYMAEEREASFYADGLRFGSISEAEVPEAIRTLL